MKRTNLSTNRLFDTPSRRSFLVLAGGTVGLAGLETVIGAQKQTFELEGGIGHWMGVSPSSIDGVENPTLELKPGRAYRVMWTNIDGFDHNFVIINGAGDEVVRSKIISERGKTQTVEFEATEDMTEYFCEIHPNSMRGEVQIAGREEAPEGTEPQIPMGSTVGLETVAEGLTAPLAFEVADEDADRRFVVDQTGQIYVHEGDGLRDELFLDISDRIVELGVPRLNGYDERGLLGLAFHPDFADNRKFYVHYSAPRREGTPEDYDHTEIIAEFTATEDLSAGDPNSERIILEIPSPQMNHDGGDIEFGPDSYLYIGMGDGGAANDVGLGHVPDWYDENEGGNGQDVEQNLMGSILRIDVDDQEGDNNYAIPDDNPLVDGDGLDEHYAWGFRNPRTMSFNDGELFVADAGQNLYEEVDIVKKGGNYGWNVKEGTHCFSTEHPNEPPEDCPDSTSDDVRGGEPLLDPIIEYRHRRSTTAMIDGSVVIGGAIYRGDAIPDLQDKYVFGNWSGQGVLEPDGEIFVATRPEEETPETPSPSPTPTETPTAMPTETSTETPTETPTDTPTQTPIETPTSTPIEGSTIELGGEVSGWQGQSPAGIKGETNPTLHLEAGQEYELTWENLDGAPHNIVIEDADGNHVVETEIVRKQGETQTVTFTATEDMAEYYCSVHPKSMKGEVTVFGGGGSHKSEKLWSLEELVIGSTDDGQLNRYVLGFGRDRDGELYVLTSENFTPTGTTGAVHKLVPAGEGEEIPTKTETETESPTETPTETPAQTPTETS